MQRAGTLLEAGTVVADRFTVERFVGAGGMGTVYRAADRLTGSPVALKLMKLGAGESLERFAREASMLADLEHPGVVRFVASGTTELGEPYLAMEWLAGETLADRLARGRLSVAETLRLGRRVAEALHAVHKRGIIHRDLKPQNLYLVEGELDRVKILDFGIARTGERRGDTITQTGAALGTPGYMSPEQARGLKAIDARADVFSLACVLFKCLTDQPPFVGDPLSIMLRVVLDPAPLVATFRDDLPHGVEALIQGMLAKDPKDRPQTAAAAAAALAALEAGGAAPPGADASRNLPGAKPAPSVPTRRPHIGRAMLAVVAAVLLLGAAASATLLLARERHEETRSAAPAATAVQCATLPCPMWFSFSDPLHVDEGEVRPHAIQLAQAVDRGASLCEITVVGTVDGTVAVVESAIAAMYFEFAAPKGGHPSMVLVYPGELVAVDVRRCGKPVPLPGCSGKVAYAQAAAATGVPRGSIATLLYRYDAATNAPVWDVSIGVGHAKLDGRTCKPKK